MTDILTTIDDTLTYHSAGLGVDLAVPVERDAIDDLGLTGHYDPYWTTALANLRQQTITLSGTYDSAADDPDWVPFTTMNGQQGFYRQVGTVVDFRLVATPLHRWVFTLPRVKTAAERKADADRRARLRRMHHLYRSRRRTW